VVGLQKPGGKYFARVLKKGKATINAEKPKLKRGKHSKKGGWPLGKKNPRGGNISPIAHVHIEQIMPRTDGD